MCNNLLIIALHVIKCTIDSISGHAYSADFGKATFLKKALWCSLVFNHLAIQGHAEQIIVSPDCRVGELEGGFPSFHSPNQHPVGSFH